MKAKTIPEDELAFQEAIEFLYNSPNFPKDKAILTAAYIERIATNNSLKRQVAAEKICQTILKTRAKWNCDQVVNNKCGNCDFIIFCPDLEKWEKIK